jgi:sugar phosphate permease
METDPTTQTKSSRLAVRVLLGFVVLYAAIYAIRLVMGVVPNLLMRQFGASAEFRAFIGSTLNYGVGIAAYILLPAIALRRLLRLDPWPRFFPYWDGW